MVDSVIPDEPSVKKCYGDGEARHGGNAMAWYHSAVYWKLRALARVPDHPAKVGLEDLVGLVKLPDGVDSVSYVRKLRDAEPAGASATPAPSRARNLMSFDTNPKDDEPIDREEYEKWEKERVAKRPSLAKTRGNITKDEQLDKLTDDILKLFLFKWRSDHHIVAKLKQILKAALPTTPELRCPVTINNTGEHIRCEYHPKRSLNE